MCKGGVYVFLNEKPFFVPSGEEKVPKLWGLRAGRGWSPGQPHPGQPLHWAPGRLGDLGGEACGVVDQSGHNRPSQAGGGRV